MGPALPYTIGPHDGLCCAQKAQRKMVVGSLVAGGNGSGFLTRAADELPEPRAPPLLERLQSAIDAAAQPAVVTASDPGIASILADAEQDRLQKNVVTAVEMIFGSAAATIAAFGRKVCLTSTSR